MDYKSAVEAMLAGDDKGRQQLYMLLKQNYYYMVSDIGDQAQAEGLFKNAFVTVVSNINNQTNPDTIGDMFRRNLEWSLSNVPEAKLQAGNQSNQGYQPNRQAGNQSNQGYQPNRQAGYQPNQGYQPNRQAGNQSNQGYQPNRQAGYQPNQG
ncbi:MAG: hypothetical protein ACI4EF_00655, partial [Coprococcus sp.]